MQTTRMFKTFSCSLLLVAIMHTAGAQTAKPFTIHGTYTGSQPVALRIGYNNGKVVNDTVIVKNGVFTFTGELTEPVVAFLSGATKTRSVDDPNFESIFIGPGDMHLTLQQDAFKQLVLTGSAMQDDSKEAGKMIEDIQKELQPLNERFNTANDAYIKARKEKRLEAELNALKEKANAIRDEFAPYSTRIRERNVSFIKAHPASLYSAYMMRFLISSMQPADALAMYQSLTPYVQQSASGKMIADEIKKMQAGSPGSKAYVFSTVDIQQKPLSLADYAGKQYVLLDFWASWCVPCRNGNPHLLELYAKYKNKGLEIIGISDDDSNHDAWKKAVTQDKIDVWKHVLRGLKINGENYDRSADISDRYGIHTLPTKILIDKNGKIAGRYGGGGEDESALDKKLAELFASNQGQ